MCTYGAMYQYNTSTRFTVLQYSHLQPLAEVNLFLIFRVFYESAHEHLGADVDGVFGFEDARHGVNIVDDAAALSVVLLVQISEVIRMNGCFRLLTGSGRAEMGVLTVEPSGSPWGIEVRLHIQSATYGL